MTDSTIMNNDQPVIEKFHDNYWRTLAKVISMRVTFTGVHIFNTWFVTGSLSAGVAVAGIAFFIFPFLYWFHERIWNHTNWGRLADFKRKFSENNWRSLSKDLTWRIVAIFGNFLVAFIGTGSFIIGIKVMSLAIFVNMIVFFLHERIWNLFSLGRTIKQIDIP
jgi:uncharacterized membrane protein